jgi:hypothetical protein
MKEFSERSFETIFVVGSGSHPNFVMKNVLVSAEGHKEPSFKSSFCEKGI